MQRSFLNPLNSRIITIHINFGDLVDQAWCTLHIVSYLKKPNSSNCWCCKHLGQESCGASNINFQKWNWAFKKSYWIRFTWPLLPKARTTIEAETTSRSAVKTWNQSHFFVKTLTNLELTLEMQTKYYFILISKRSPGRKCQKIKFSQEGGRMYHIL